jgi:hypothetical protein
MTHSADAPRHVIAMRTHILPGDIGTENLKAVSVTVEDQATFSALGSISETPRSKKESELERHVEPRQAMHCIKSGTG